MSKSKSRKLREKAPSLHVKFKTKEQRAEYLRSVSNMNKVSPKGKDILIGGQNSHPSRIKPK